MYQSLRETNPAQYRLTPLGQKGAHELLREASGIGSSVFMWRATITPTGQNASILDVEASRPFLDPDGYEKDIREAVKRCQNTGAS